MEVKIKHLDHVKFAIQTRSHTILCDQPAENGGDDAGMTPPELMLASLGSCAAFYAAQYLKARNLEETGVEVSVTADKLMQPPGSATSRSMSYARSPSPKTRTRASCALYIVVSSITR
jgi:uncharacterized OsmC-like protein